jgi:hypothetical protein
MTEQSLRDVSPLDRRHADDQEHREIEANARTEHPESQQQRVWRLKDV